MLTDPLNVDFFPFSFFLYIQFAQSFNTILLEKQKQNTYTSQDGNKRKTQSVKDNFMPVSVDKILCKIAEVLGQIKQVSPFFLSIELYWGIYVRPKGIKFKTNGKPSHSLAANMYSVDLQNYLCLLFLSPNRGKFKKMYFK